MKTNIPYYNEGGIQHMAPEGLGLLLAGFRLMPQTLPFNLFVFRFNQTNDANGSDFSYEVLINTIDKNLVIVYGLSDGAFIIKSSNGKEIKGFNTDKMFFDSLKFYVYSSAVPYSVLGCSDKGDWRADDGIPFYTMDHSGFPANGVSDNQLGYLIFFDLEPETLNSITQTV